MKKFFIFLSIFLFVFCPFNVLAEESKSIYCPLCEHRDDDDPLYNKERQFYNKIHLIKTVFGNSIDEVALAAAVLHRYNNKELAYEREYDEDFSAENWKKMWEDTKSSRTAKVTDDNGDLSISSDEAEKIEANEQLDLITTAAIVMIDSNQFGTYSDVCFKDGLAGDGLVGNTLSDGTADKGPFVKLFNGLFCGAYNVVEGAISPIDFVAGLFNGDSLLVRRETVKRRFVNINSVCENGYVGGLYGISNVKDENKKKELKNLYAQQIIDFANYYKKLYGKYTGDSETCTSNSAGSSGSFSSWKQNDSKWKDIQIGSSSSDTVGTIGCLVTSMAMQISRSGTSLGPLPSGQSEFNPGSFALALKENNGFESSGNLVYSGTSKIAPNFKFGEFKSTNIRDNKTLADTISKELSTGYEDKYQKFIILFIKHKKSNSHWVAVDSVSGDKVLIFDPAGSGNTLDDNYENWVVAGYNVMYATDVMQGQVKAGGSSGCGGCDLNRFIGFIAYHEGHDMCNFQGKGENTGYGTGYLAGDTGGQTSAFGLTSSDDESALKIGYTSYLSELYSGCTEKENTEKLLLASIDNIREITQQQLDDIGVTVNEHEMYALISVNYGGITLARKIIKAIKEYGKESEQVFEAFKNSFGHGYALGIGAADGLMRRRLAEYEMFMTGNYEVEAAQYLGWSGMYSKGLAISMKEVQSHFPTKREELLEGMPFAPIDGKCATGSSTDGNLICKGGNATSSGSANYSGGKGSLTAEQRQKIVEFAKSQIGVKYNNGKAWKDDEPGVQLTCNGLTYYAYKAAGVEIMEGSDNQMLNTPVVTSSGKVSEMTPGDIIVFDAGGLYSKRSSDIGQVDTAQVNTGVLYASHHVAIYIGDGKMIESPNVNQFVKETPIGDYQYSYSLTV